MPEAAIALPTGSTPIGLYDRWVERAATGEVQLNRAHFFNLDEYAGLPQADSHSFAAFLHRHFLDRAAIDPARVRLLRGDAPDLEGIVGPRRVGSAPVIARLQARWSTASGRHPR